MSNIINSGLVTTVGGLTYLTDVKNYSGTYVVDMFGNVEKVINNALFWYGVNIGKYIFFSNQMKNNSLYSYNSQNGEIQQVNEISCRNLIKHENDIFFVDDSSKNIMKCNVNNYIIEQFSDNRVEIFSIAGNALYYSAATGIGMIDINTKKEYGVLSSVANIIGCWNNMLVYSDFKSEGVICVYNLLDGRFFKIDSICSESIVTYENYIFATNIKDRNSIYRIDISKGEVLRIFGDSAFNLHVSGSEIYFTDREDNWCRISVFGDNYMQIKID